MSVHYKFKSALEYDTVTFDGLHISIKDLKNAIIQQKRIGKNTDFDLQVTNAQTKKVYNDDQSLIPKNTSLLIARVPLAVQNKAKTWEGYGHDNIQSTRQDEGSSAVKAVDLSSLDAPEDDKIMAMMTQSTQDYDPSKFTTNYVKIRGANQVGQVPPNYRCYKCHQSGHWIKDCPLSQGNDQLDIKKSTGIPRSFMVEVEGPQVQGAMMTPYGSYAVPALDHQTYTQKGTPVTAPPPMQKTNIPDDLMCSICSDLLTDAVMIPCCGNSFCDECIRSCLLESEDHECPDCHERDISPGTLIPNRFLRNSVANFKSTTGYVKRQVYKPAAALGQIARSIPSKRKTPDTNKAPTAENSKRDDEQKPDIDKLKEEKEVAYVPGAATDDTVASSEKPIISEADSTEPPKFSFPGVSPTRDRSPEMHPTVITRSHGPRSAQDRGSPRRQGRYSIEAEDRSGTPTVDEPGNPITVASGDNYRPYSTLPLPPPPRHHMQGPMHRQIQNNHLPYNNNNNNPQQMHYIPPQQPHGIMQGVQSNYRMQQSHHRPPGYIGNGGGMYNMPPRAPLYDQRPPMQQGNMPPQQCSYGYQNRPPRMRSDYNSRPVNPQTSPGIIDDPLEAFNRMLREKDERERRAKAATRKGRSYSRSSSRSYSRSPPSRRRSSRSPRRRTRSRSNSFSISRSRSRSYSSNHHDTSYRDYSPRRRPPSRYRSYQYRSPTRYRERSRHYNSRERDHDRNRDRDRDYPPARDNRGDFPPRGPPGEYNAPYYDSYEREKSGSRNWIPPPREGYYPQPPLNHGLVQHPPHQQQVPNYQQQQGPPPPHMHQHNRYGRDYQPPNLPLGGNYKPSLLLDPPIMMQGGGPPPAPQRRFVDVLPPGTDQPLPPGEEPIQRFEPPPRYQPNSMDCEQRSSEYEWDQRADERYCDDQRPLSRLHERQQRPPTLERDRDRETNTSRDDRDKVRDRERRRPSRDNTDKDKEKEKDTRVKDKRTERESRSSSRHASSSLQKRKSRRDDSPFKSRDKDKKKDKDRDPSEDEKSKKSKDKKKKREKRDNEKRKKKDRKDRREIRKEEKESKKDEEAMVEGGKEDDGKKTEKVAEAKSEERQLKPSETQITSGEISQEEGEIIEPADDLIVETNDPHNSERFSGSFSDRVDTDIVESHVARKNSLSPVDINPSKVDTPEATLHKDKEEDVLELDTGELKSEMDKESTVPTPQLFKWEMEDEPTELAASEHDAKLDKSKVTQDVLKRAENAIFAKAINAIRPIEIKKISTDRAKLYSGEKDMEESPKKEDVKDIEKDNTDKPAESTKEIREHVEIEEAAKAPPVRLSVKERLGHKVDDLDRQGRAIAPARHRLEGDKATVSSSTVLPWRGSADRIVQIDIKERNKSRSLSPVVKRTHENKDRRVIEVHRRRSPFEDRTKDRDRKDKSNRDKDRDRRDSRRDDSRIHKSKPHDRDRRRDDKASTSNKERIRTRLDERDDGRGRPTVQSAVCQPSKHENKPSEKRKRSRTKSKSESKDDRKKKDKKQRKERDKDKESDIKDKDTNIIEKIAKDKESARTFKKVEDILEKQEKGSIVSGKIELADKSNTKVIDSPGTAPIAGKVSKRKVTLDEENFIPDYDAESEHDQPETDAHGKTRRVDRQRTSSSSSDTSSDEVKKRKKHKKHSKKKKRRETSSSSSSDSSSSEDEKEKSKRKKHRKKKKKKKSKHKS